MSREYIGKSKEDYLEAILMQIKKNGACRATDIAAEMKVSKPSVSVALRKMEEDGLIERQDWRVLLTEKGMDIANRMWEKHEYFTAFFTKIGIEPSVAREEACQMEHVISDDSFHKLVSYLEAME